MEELWTQIGMSFEFTNLVLSVSLAYLVWLGLLLILLLWDLAYAQAWLSDFQRRVAWEIKCSAALFLDLVGAIYISFSGLNYLRRGLRFLKIRRSSDSTKLHLFLFDQAQAFVNRPSLDDELTIVQCKAPFDHLFSLTYKFVTSTGDDFSEAWVDVLLELFTISLL